jgi:uncharacterized protein (DUF2062 family)
MIDNNVHPMLVGAVALGLATMFMAWIIFVIGVKGWAVEREDRWKRRALART